MKQSVLMKKGILTILIILGVVLYLFQNITLAQPPFEPPPRKRLKEVGKRIEMLKMWRLTKELNLDESMAAKVFPLMNRFDRKRMDLEIERFRLMRELRGMIREDISSEDRDKRIEDIMKRLDENREALHRLRREERRALRKIFTPRQMAQYLLFQKRFEREIKHLIRKHRRHNGRWKR